MLKPLGWAVECFGEVDSPARPRGINQTTHRWTHHWTHHQYLLMYDPSQLQLNQQYANQYSIQADCNCCHHDNWMRIYRPPCHLCLLPQPSDCTLVDHGNQDTTIFCDTLNHAYEYAWAILSLDFDNVRSNKVSSDTPFRLVYLQGFSWCRWHPR